MCIQMTQAEQKLKTNEHFRLMLKPKTNPTVNLIPKNNNVAYQIKNEKSLKITYILIQNPR